jgi:hypothetical protein
MKKAEFEKLADELITTEEIKLGLPCSEADLNRILSDLKIEIPSEFAELLQDFNGLAVYHSLSIWSIEEIIETNSEYWQEDFLSDLYMPFKSLFFFADAGNGDLFAYRILDGQIPYNDIYAWDHENDSRVWVASNLRDFVKRSLKNELNIN